MSVPSPAPGADPSATSEEELFAAACDLPPEERSAFLARACADNPTQRARIEALLAAFDASEDFLQQPIVNRLPLPNSEKPGDRIGDFTLIRQLGEGGCGVVYLAEQRHPIRRRIALKVIKWGMDTRQVSARFELERQALAMMDHPDIARVFDAGSTPEGRPFFAMEYVDGVPLTTFCDEQRLGLRARLELFSRVGLAVQHAHQKGIIHRDLKPSNILVAWRDGAPAPKVIDFGIAKAISERLTDATLVTQVDQFMGTPTYMSPEQADRREFDIDTRSDVYALGVLLYELLTSRLPHDSLSLSALGVDEVRRRIREVEPPRLSRRVSLLPAAECASIAARRLLDPRKLAAQLRGDLDWIVLRCLEKDRSRRYSSVQQLVEDVQRHLRNEPVEASPPRALYRVRKFVVRNRLACLSAAAITLALVVASIVSTSLAIRAMRAESVANLARTDAQRHQEEAEDLLSFMIGDFRSELQKIGRLNVLDAVGDRAMAYFAAREPRDLTDTALTRKFTTLTQIGEIRMDQARYREASAAFTSAHQGAAALAARYPQDPDKLYDRAQTEFWIGYVAWERKDIPTARHWLTRYRDSAIELVALEGTTPRAQLEYASGLHNLAVLETENGNLSAARTGFRTEATEIRRLLADQPNASEPRAKLADNASWLGRVEELDGHFEEAIGHFREMARSYRGLAQEAPSVTRWQVEGARSAMFLGEIQLLLDHVVEARAAYAEARTMFAQLCAADPSNRRWQANALSIQLMEATFRRLEAPLNPTATLWRETRRQLHELYLAEPASERHQRLLATAWRLEADWLFATHQPGATDAIQSSLDLGRTLLAERHATPRIAGEYAQSCLLAGRIAQARHQPAAANRHWTNALEVLQPLLPTSNDYQILDPAAQALVLTGRAPDAQPLIERLRQFHYHSADPLAAAILPVANATPAPEPTNPD